MRYFDLIQGSPEWFAARAGIPTASRASSIITPAEMKYSKSAGPYQNLLIAELLLGRPLDSDAFKSFSTERGGALEGDAGALYAMLTSDKLERGGFITNDDFTAGASPDRRVLKPNGKIKKLVEIKVPDPDTHIGNLVANVIDRAYYPQVQWQIWVAGEECEAVDWMSFHPELPPSIISTPRDDDFIAKLEEAVGHFHTELQKKMRRLLELGHIEAIPEYKRPKETAAPFWDQAADVSHETIQGENDAAAFG